MQKYRRRIRVALLVATLSTALTSLAPLTSGAVAPLEPGVRRIRLTVSATVVSGAPETARALQGELVCRNIRLFGATQGTRASFRFRILPSVTPTVVDLEVVNSENPCDFYFGTDPMYPTVVKQAAVNGKLAESPTDITLDLVGDTKVELQYANTSGQVAPVPPAGYNTLRTSLNFDTGQNEKYKVRFDGCTDLPTPPVLGDSVLKGTFGSAIDVIGPPFGRVGSACTLVATAEGVDLAKRLVVMLNGTVQPVVDNGGGVVSIRVPFEGDTALNTYLRPVNRAPLVSPTGATAATPTTTPASGAVATTAVPIPGTRSKPTTTPSTRTATARAPKVASKLCLRRKGKKYVQVAC
jgi:hypothetical protein